MTNKIVIIGGSFAGIAACKALLPHIASLDLELTLIERRDSFYYNPASVRATVDATFVNKLFIPYWSLLQNYPRTQFVQASVTQVLKDHVVVDKDGQVAHIAYDYLVVATGCSYGFPFRCDYASTQVGVDEYAALHAVLATSNNVTVVGGGATGCELAAEIKGKHPSKQVTLVHSQPKLCPELGDETFRTRVASQLKRLGVKVLVGERVASHKPSKVWNSEHMVLKTSKGTEIESDMQFWTVGSSRPNVQFMDALFEQGRCECEQECKHEQQHISATGQLRVKDTLQLAAFNNIFAPGDVNDYSAPKLAYTARWQGQHVATSIMQLIQGRGVLHYCSLLPTELAVIPLGKTSGVTYVPYLGVWGSWLTWLVKGRDLFLPSTWHDFKLAVPSS